MDDSAAPMTRRSSSASSLAFGERNTTSLEHEASVEVASASTPPTSVNDARSTESAEKPVRDTRELEASGFARRPKRTRSNISTYNLKRLADIQSGLSTPASGRNVSRLNSSTLLAGEDDEDEAGVASGISKKIKTAEESDEEPDVYSPVRRSPRNFQRRLSMGDRTKKAVSKMQTVLGKRGRGVSGSAKEKSGPRDVPESSKQKRILRELDLGIGGVLDEIDLDVDFPVQLVRPTKKHKISGKLPQKMSPRVPDTTIQRTSTGKRVKKWEEQGLYVGQVAGDDDQQSKSGSPLKQTATSSSLATAGEAANGKTARKYNIIPLPMFGYLDKTRDFVIPFDVFASFTKRGDEKPKDWTKINRNRIVGDAKDLWERVGNLPTSACVCKWPAPDEKGCGDDCLNKVMSYECNDDNCNLDAEHCGNRPYAALQARIKKGGPYDIGVEVVKTAECGFGVRACRAFGPGEIIMEYTGEVISEGECQRRMREVYHGKQCYYLMELERGLIIDGTKGSMARFINHSCAPNCEVKMTKVNELPRMAVFAGENGIATGEELTYDYNFDNFGTTQQKCFCGAPMCRGFLSKRLNAVEQKKRIKEEEEKKRKAQEEAAIRAAAEAKKKQIKDGRGAAWRGWVAVDDPDVKEKLREEKKAKELAAMTSARALRLAARRTSLPDQSEQGDTARGAKRRKTTHRAASPEPAAAEDDGPQRLPASSPPPSSSSSSNPLRASRKSARAAPDASKASKSTESLHGITTSPPSTGESGSTSSPDDSAEDARPPRRSVGDGAAVDQESVRGLLPKGKGVVKSIGQAIKNGLVSGKLKQSKLSFSRLG